MKRGPPLSHTLKGGHLKGIAELHDLSFEYQIAPLLRLLSQELEVLPDLLHPRPWLEQQGIQNAQQVLEAILEQEWSGFLAHLGQVGPWVFAPTVADLQALSRQYSLLVERASTNDLGGSEPTSLLGRLAASGVGAGQESPDETWRAEQVFWALAQTRAARQRDAWATSRGRR